MIPYANLLIFIILFATTSWFSAAAAEPKVDSAKLAAIPRAMQNAIERHEIAGAVTLFATRDKILALDAVGMADIAANKRMKADDLFWIASMTKPITATAIMMLQEEGKLSVEDPVGKYIPELAHLKTADGKEHVVTLHHLLTHSAGMPEPSGVASRSSQNLAELIPHFAEKPLEFVPGSKWQYSQSGINTLGRVIEIVSGESYPAFLQRRLFDPLGLKNTTFYPTPGQIARIAKSYKLTDGKLEPVPTPFLRESDAAQHEHYPAPNAGLFSTASDYGRFLQMILNQGELDGRRYLKPQTVKLMTSVQSGDLKTGFTPGNGWGLGWCIIRHPQGVTEALSPGSCGHGGAYGTQGWIDPEKGLVYVLMVQRANFPNSDASEVRKDLQDAAAAAVEK